jgi:two-component system, NarL family, nitrate/nitrite response regulator NarL
MPKLQNENISPLSLRELQIVTLICKEYTSEEIAATLQISKRTVDEHRIRIMQKLQKNTTVGIVIHAIKNGLFKIR